MCAALEDGGNLLRKKARKTRHLHRERETANAFAMEKTQLSEKSHAGKMEPIGQIHQIIRTLLPDKTVVVIPSEHDAGSGNADIIKPGSLPGEEYRRFVFDKEKGTSETRANTGAEDTGRCAALDGLKFDTILAFGEDSMAIKGKMIASGQNVLIKIRVGDFPSEAHITGAEEKFLHEELIYSYLSDPVSGDSVNMMKTSNVPVDGIIRDGRCVFFQKGHAPGGMRSGAPGHSFIGSQVPEGYPGHYNYEDKTIVTESEGTKTNVDCPALRACTGQDPQNPVCYIQILELPYGVFPIGKSSSESSNVIRRAPTMKKAKALLFQIIYGLAYQFKTIGFQHWRLDETNIMTREWPIGRKLICYLIKQSNGTKETDIGDAVRCLEKESLTYPTQVGNSAKGQAAEGQAAKSKNATTEAEPTTTEALTTTGAPATSGAPALTTAAPATSGAATPTTGAPSTDKDGAIEFIQENEGRPYLRPIFGEEAIDFILSDFVGSSAGCGESCGEACDTCGELKRVVSRSRSSLNDRSSLLLLWAKIRPCGLSLKGDFPNMDEIEGLLSLDTDCPEDQKPVLSKKVERAWIQAIWNIPTDIRPDATEVTEDQYAAYKMHYRAVSGHNFFTFEGVQDHFDSFTTPAIDMQHCVESPECVIRGCEPGDERCRTLSNTNEAVVNMS